MLNQPTNSPRILRNELTGEEISGDQLKSIANLCQRQVAVESEIEKVSGILDHLNAQLKALSETSIPEAMMAIGLEEFTLASGEKVSVKKFYSASIPGDRLLEALAWLRSHDHGDIIKNSVSVQFGKGEDDTAKSLVDDLRNMGLSPDQKTFVHPMTLKSFVKDRIESAQELPHELFGVFVGNKTKIAPKK